MSAIVCGKRSSIFEDSLSLTANPPVSKRIRCSSSSPVRFSPPRQNNSSFPSPYSNHSPPHLIEHLKAIFPYMDHKVLEKALGECGDNLDSAIRSLNELHIGSTDNNLDSASAKFDVTPEANVQSRGAEIANGEVGASEELSAPQDPPMDGADWVELFVREMMSSSNVDDARARTSRVLEVLERSIRARSSASAEAAQTIHQENMMLKEQVESLIQENTILKRAVSIQHDRQKENEERSQELLHLKQLVSQYQEQLRTLEWTMLFGMEISIEVWHCEQLCIDNAPEAVSAKQLHPRTFPPRCLLVNLGYINLALGMVSKCAFKHC